MLKDIKMPEGLKTIGDFAFAGCSSITQISLPRTITHIGISSFSDCKSLCNISFPISLIDIGISAFSGCVSLSSIIVHGHALKISKYAFKDCQSLKQITIKNARPTEIEFSEHAFEELDLDNIVLKVPANTREEYMRIKVFRKFKCIVELPQYDNKNKSVPTN